MGEMSAALLAAMQGDRVIPFGAVEVNLPGHDIRLLDGSAVIDIGANRFSGIDATFGTLSTLSALSDGVGDDAPPLNIGFQPPSDVATAALASADMQGARVRVYFGAVNPATGLAIPDPIVLFDGEVDVPTISWDSHSRDVEFRCVSVFEKFFSLEEGIRLSDSHHQYVWPGELGCAFITGVAEKVNWGVAGDA